MSCARCPACLPPASTKAASLGCRLLTSMHGPGVKGAASGLRSARRRARLGHEESERRRRCRRAHKFPVCSEGFIPLAALPLFSADARGRSARQSVPRVPARSMKPRCLRTESAPHRAPPRRGSRRLTTAACTRRTCPNTPARASRARALPPRASHSRHVLREAFGLARTASVRAASRCVPRALLT